MPGSGVRVSKEIGGARVIGDGRQDFATPWPFIRAVEARFGPIAFDLAAHDGNTKCDRYLTEEDDSLSIAWHRLRRGELLWLNPPFRRMRPWVAKCEEESRLGARIALLGPASVGTEWFADHVFGKALVLPARPRLTFIGEDDPYPKDLMVCYYSPHGEAGFDLWRWDK